ncbi:MAG TPA: cytochrome c [Bradyrhizobium sp.]
MSTNTRGSMIPTAAVIVAMAFGVAAVTAQSDPIAARQALMKTNGKQAKLGSDMIRGKVRFDLDNAKAIFLSFIDAANKMPNLFPENSKTGGDTSAAPEIWANMDDFKARFAKLAADSKAALETVKDRESFTAAYRNVNRTCDGCHEHYRVKKS